MSEKQIVVNDRVKRNDAPGCFGVVMEIREELIPASRIADSKALLCKVRWDDGIQSYYELSYLEKVA